MKITQRISTAFNVLRNNPTKNSMGTNLARDFLRWGNRGNSRMQAPLMQEWSQVVMDEKSLYTGYMYAAINNRANGVAQLAENNLVTTAIKAVEDEASKKEDVIIHPYLEILDDSISFSNYKFWYGTSAYLDLQGVYYLMVIRNVAYSEIKDQEGNLVRTEVTKVGEIQEFKLLNPYHVKRIVNKKTGELGGYREEKNGKYRDIPAEMIIEIRKFNPFSSTDPYSTTDAAKDSQFTMKQTGDFTRHAIAKNLNSPGIVSVGDSDLMVDENEFKNFKSRILGHEKGEPIFALGNGSLNFDPMQVDLDKAALNDINEISLNGIIATTGNSKTMFGIEQSGVTRDTAKVQKDLFIANHVIPQLQLIVDAFNLDYKRYYPEEFKRNEYKITIDSPLKTDRDAEKKDSEIKQANFDLYDSLVQLGYDAEQAAKYVEGKIDLETLSTKAPEPKKPEETKPPAKDETKPKDGEQKSSAPVAKIRIISKAKQAKPEEHQEHDHIAVNESMNELNDQQKGLIQQQQGALENIVINLQARLVSDTITKIEKRMSKATNAANEDYFVWDESDIITKANKKEYEAELELALAAFYGIVFMMWSPNVNSKRFKEFNKDASFTIDKEAKNYIKDISSKASKSHIQTVLDTILIDVRAQAKAGAGINEIVSSLTKKFQGEISKTRAKAIARTETNRAFTMTQYEYDRQWLKQNADYFKEQGTSPYKVWHTRSTNPCGFCEGLASSGPIPFDEPFANIGDTLSYTDTDKNGDTRVKKMVVAFDTPVAGNLHTNCACDYQIVFK